MGQFGPALVDPQIGILYCAPVDALDEIGVCADLGGQLEVNRSNNWQGATRPIISALHSCLVIERGPLLCGFGGVAN